MTPRNWCAFYTIAIIVLWSSPWWIPWAFEVDGSAVQVANNRLSPSTVPDRIITAAGPRLATIALGVAFTANRRFNRFARHHNKNGTDDVGIFQINDVLVGVYAPWFLSRGIILDRNNVSHNLYIGIDRLSAGWTLYGTERGAHCHFAHPARCGR